MLAAHGQHTDNTQTTQTTSNILINTQAAHRQHSDNTQTAQTIFNILTTDNSTGNTQTTHKQHPDNTQTTQTTNDISITHGQHRQHSGNTGNTGNTGNKQHFDNTQTTRNQHIGSTTHSQYTDSTHSSQPANAQANGYCTQTTHRPLHSSFEHLHCGYLWCLVFRLQILRFFEGMFNILKVFAWIDLESNWTKALVFYQIRRWISKRFKSHDFYR
jgi:hypothetical protein